MTGSVDAQQSWPLGKDQDAADTLQEMFDQFAANAGPLAPMFGKLSDEQRQALEQVEISIADERRFGNPILNAYLKQLQAKRIGITKHGADAAYVSALVNQLKPQLRNARRYPRVDVRVVASGSADAYSIPGGHIIVTSGMLETCGSEAALVGVLRTELSHLDHGHQLLPLKQAQLSRRPLDFEDGMFLMSLVARPFRPEQEQEADLDATQWMMAAGYEALELARLLSSWNRRQAQTTPWLDFVPNFVKSHPDPGRRAADIARRAAALKARYPQSSYVGRENLEKRILKSRREFP